jgi:hypothetical protein
MSKIPKFVVILVITICLVESFRPRHTPAVAFLGARGGATADRADESDQNAKTLEKYVEAMEQRDHEAHYTEQEEPSDTAVDDDSEEYGSNSNIDKQRKNAPAAAATNDDNDDDATVGVKSHGKKSNAVGDPDSESSDDDDDDDESENTDWMDLEEMLNAQQLQRSEHQQEVQVEVEVLQQQQQQQIADDDDDDSTTTPHSGGGVGVRRYRRRGGNKEKAASTKTSARRTHQHAQAWLPYIYLPPAPKALSHLSTHATASSHRLDRRTLYASLLKELQNSTIKSESSRRKFLDPATSQALQAALSLATQPQWRQAAPQSSGVLLYSNDSPTSATLSMQETVIMALVCLRPKQSCSADYRFIMSAHHSDSF